MGPGGNLWHSGQEGRRNVLWVFGFITPLYVAGPDPTGARSPQPSSQSPHTSLLLPYLPPGQDNGGG
jgi:hypothetical protein